MRHPESRTQKPRSYQQNVMQSILGDGSVAPGVSHLNFQHQPTTRVTRNKTYEKRTWDPCNLQIRRKLFHFSPARVPFAGCASFRIEEGPRFPTVFDRQPKQKRENLSKKALRRDMIFQSVSGRDRRNKSAQTFWMTHWPVCLSLAGVGVPRKENPPLAGRPPAK